MSVNEIVLKNSIRETMSKAFSGSIFWVVSFALLTGFAAQVVVPVQPVPFTLQTLLVLLSGAFLGSKNGFYSQILYLGMGAAGVPVFAELHVGTAVLLGPTGGYLIAFPFAAFLTGLIIENYKSTASTLIAMFSGSAMIMLTGALYLSVFFGGNLGEALFAGAVIFTPWAILKSVAGFSIYKSLMKKYPRLPQN